MPSANYNGESEVFKFTNFHHNDIMPIVAYEDFLKSVNKFQSKYSTVNDMREPMSFSVYFVFDYSLPDNIKPKLPKASYLYRGVNEAYKVRA